MTEPLPPAAPEAPTDAGRAPGETASSHPSGSWWPLLPISLLCYLPLLATRPGWVSADTKSYLYLDPDRLLSRAWSMWDPSVGLGTVSHQTIGYLWPMGPWFWAFDHLGVPDWVAQRLWWGTLLFAATAGMAYLLRRFEWPAVAVWPAALAYGLSPYAVAYLPRLSGVLLPAIGLPWLLAFTIQSLRTKGWRYPALFALVVTTVGSVNLTALVLVGIAPLLWVGYAWVSREVPWRSVVAALGRIGVLSLATSAWWFAGLSVQATHGIDIVRYSESAEVVSRASVSFELLRGFGYWFFYGGDKLQLWNEASFEYTQRPWIFAVSFALPLFALWSGGVVRWRHRTFFALVLVIGVLVSIGAHPWGDPPVLGAVVKAFLGTDRGLAFRSLPRAVPLVALASAVLVGAGVGAMARHGARLGRVAGGVVVAFAIVAMVPLWQRTLVQDGLSRREELPEHWTEAARLLDERDDGTRVLELPGTDFASYRWGNTVDPITPGLMDRPYVARELVPYGTPPSADLLNSFDLLLQERTLDPAAVAPIARLLRAGDLVVRGDLQYERYNLARPKLVWRLARTAPGLGDPIELTEPTANEPSERLQLQDETWLLQESGLADSPAVAIVPVEGARPIVDLKPSQGAVVLSGDGAGIVDAATAGLIDGNELIRYSGSLDTAEIDAELERQAQLVVTDTDRKRGERWGSLRHTRGYTERVDEEALAENLTDNRLPRFEGRGSDVQTVTIQRGGIEADATTYGNPITFAGDGRPALAVDGDPETAWATAAFSDARGERIVLTLDEPTEIDHLVLYQLPEERTRRMLTTVEVDVGDGDPVEVQLGPESRLAPGQRVELGERTTDRVEITLVADNLDNPMRYGDAGPVGFSEIEIGDDPPVLDEVVRMPTDLVDAVADSDVAGAEGAPLTYLMTRIRQDPTDRTRDDEERAMARRFRVPADRTFALSGTARLSGRAADPILDELLGTTIDGVTVDSSLRLSGSRLERASAALDGDLTTAWVGPFARTTGEHLTVTTDEPRTWDQLDLAIVADGRHSVPTALKVLVDGEVVAEPSLPAIADGDEPGHTERVPIELPPTEGRELRVEIAGIRSVSSIDWTSAGPLDHPVAIAELGIDGLEVPVAAAELDGSCRDDLLEIDGEPVAVRILGTSAEALAGAPLAVEPCSTAGIELDAGDHELQTELGVVSGLDLDQLVLASPGDEPAPAPAPVGEATVVRSSPDRLAIDLADLTPGEPVWLVLGQSYSDGWEATVDGEALGTPQLVDGYANGWLITPEGTEAEVQLTFAPQGRVKVALAISAVGILACLVLLLRRPTGDGDRPSLVFEERMGRGRPSGVLAAGGLGLAVMVASLLVIDVVAAVALGVATAVALVSRRAHGAVGLLPVALVGAAVAYATALLVRYHIAPGMEWVVELERVHPISLAGVLSLGVVLLVDAVWRHRVDRRAEAGPEGPEA